MHGTESPTPPEPHTSKNRNLCRTQPAGIQVAARGATTTGRAIATDKRVTGRGAAISAGDRDKEKHAWLRSSIPVWCLLPAFIPPGTGRCPSGRKWPTGRLFIANLEDTFTGHCVRNICSVHKRKQPNRPVTGRRRGHRSVAMTSD